MDEDLKRYFDRQFSSMREQLEATMDRRFDAMEQRFDGKIDQLRQEMNQRFDGVDQRFDGVDQRFDGVDQRFDGVDQRFNGVEADIRQLKSDVQQSYVLIESIQGQVRLVADGVANCNEQIQRHREEVAEKLEAVEDLDLRVRRLESAAGLPPTGSLRRSRSR